MDEETLQNIASLEGQIMGQRLVLAMLIYAVRTETPFDLVCKEIETVYPQFADGVPTLFPDQRDFFLVGMQSSPESAIGMAGAIAEIMAAKGYRNPTDG